jgi:hypothetical protein
MAEWPEAYGDGRADADGDAEGETELPDPPT